ncbi:uncharacterized protein K444DRAFT_620243 [Hyaloscypha bicolor E]|uniref:Uncharacterized protein n=1 Tax=Hyaloscypha bicolor E TaxID=1095630 RepID=A0A2J6SK09_9HELO|nr:uncharacterized protein K444DRAFT_620243 [Hyaloscypha bicolor E]PMD51070.1 hypothetical protein K444DRAFT_620243 [Hyaloscypha bicolor E]
MEIETGLWCPSTVLVVPVLDMPCDGRAAIAVPVVVLVIVMPPAPSYIFVYRRTYRCVHSRCHAVIV